MRRITRSITEMESFRDTLLDIEWRTPRQNMMLAWTYTAINAMHQIAILEPTAVPCSKINKKVDVVSEMISQVNRELDDQEDE